MKNLCLSFALIFSLVFANAQCVIDSAAQTQPGISPKPDSIPCIIISQSYDQTLQVQCATSFDTVVSLVGTSYPLTVNVDSVEIDSIINLPAGLTWVKNPYRLKGGQNGCITFSGTGTGPTGRYNLTWYGTIWATLPSPIPSPYNKQTYTGNLNKLPQFNYYLDVINQGGVCHAFATGETVITADLASKISVYPNPGNGLFTLKLNTVTESEGTINVIDFTGRVVYSQHLGLTNTINLNLTGLAKGLYELQLKTSNETAVKNISIQ